MTQLIKYLADNSWTIFLPLLFLQSCSGAEGSDETDMSVYSIGNFESNIVIKGNKYTTRYGLDQKDPTFYVNKFGDVLSIAKLNGSACAVFGVEFALSRSESLESLCSGWKFRKSSKQNGIDIYLGYCPHNTEACPGDFHNKPMLEYGLNDRGGLVFVRFDPQAPDSKQYVLRMGNPFLLN